MRFTKQVQRMIKLKTNNFTSLLNKISLFQISVLGFTGIIFFINKENEIFTGLLISSLAACAYTQLIKFSSYSKIFSLMGFPLRLLVIAPPCAILVHKLHSNLIALFIGFAVCQFIFILFFWLHAKQLVKENTLNKTI